MEFFQQSACKEVLKLTFKSFSLLFFSKLQLFFHCHHEICPHCMGFMRQKHGLQEWFIVDLSLQPYSGSAKKWPYLFRNFCPFKSQQISWSLLVMWCWIVAVLTKHWSILVIVFLSHGFKTRPSHGHLMLILEDENYFSLKSHHLKIGGTIRLTEWNTNLGTCNNVYSSFFIWMVTTYIHY